MKRLLVLCLAWLVVALLLWLPVDQALEALELDRMRRRNVLATLGLVSALFALAGLFRSRWVWALLLLSLVTALLVRMTYYGLIHFSGAGFTDEFFLHLEWQSVLVAFKEYGLLMGLAGLGVLAIVVFGFRLRSAMVQLNRVPGFVLLAVGLVLMIPTREVIPEWQLLRAWQAWNQPLVIEIDPEVEAAFRDIGLVETDLVPKRRLSASAPERPRNLILLYLESVGVNLAARDDWPGLMPNFERLVDEHAWMDSIWTSSYITIEGITNMQCGTLFPFGRGSDSLAEGDGLAEQLPCLGDVLRAAGYHQVYMGGAGMGFAGKGHFLGAHGYDELLGMEHWREQGLEQRPGKWGLSDTELFEQSIDQLHRLHAKDQPFNLTLLTIGTHLPGYLYRECDPYPEGEDRFLDALHCADQLLGAWLQRLQDEGLLYDTLLVITADHHVFPNPDMRALFGDDVLDRRLPLIVIGEDLPEPQQASGAGYDLPPTVLDLLGIQHNARFILGRSLASESSRPDYFVKRYADIHEGQVVQPQANGCSEQDRGDLTLPLNTCHRQQLTSLLATILAGMSRPPDEVICGLGTSGNFASLPSDPDGVLEIVLGGQKQSDRFIFQGRPVNPARRGLFVLALDEAGVVLQRQFVPEPDAEGQVPEQLLEVDDANEFVVLHHVGGRQNALPLIEVLGPSGERLMGKTLDASADTELVFDISSRFCAE